jgi:hypothetical protein
VIGCSLPCTPTDRAVWVGWHAGHNSLPLLLQTLERYIVDENAGVIVRVDLDLIMLACTLSDAGPCK